VGSSERSSETWEFFRKTIWTRGFSERPPGYGAVHPKDHHNGEFLQKTIRMRGSSKTTANNI
jgi:hypothetical protein